MLRFLRSSAACLALGLGAPAFGGEVAEATAAAPASPAIAAPEAPAAPAAVPVPAVAPVKPAASAMAAAFPDDQPPSFDDPMQAPDESLLGTLVRMLLVLGVVVALIYLTLNVGLRRLMRAMPMQQSLLTVHERTPLEPKKSLYLVEVAGEFLLLGVGEREVNLVSRLDAEKAREVLAKRAEHKLAAPKPFWQRLTVQAPPKRPSGEPPREGPA